MRRDPSCIFCKIAAGEIPARKVFEDDEILAFHDIHPAAPVHFLMIPKDHLPSLADADESDAPVLGRLLALAGNISIAQLFIGGGQASRVWTCHRQRWSRSPGRLRSCHSPPRWSALPY